MDKVRKALVQKLLQYRLPTDKIERCERCGQCVWVSGTGNRRLCPFNQCVLIYGWGFKRDLKSVKTDTRKP